MFRKNLPPASKRWTGFPKFNFIGGHGDRESVPVADLIAAAAAVLDKKGRELATYHMDSGPQGLLELRQFVAQRLKQNRGINCDADSVMITSGSAQGLSLVNNLLLDPGDTVLAEEFTFGLMVKLIESRGARAIPMPLDEFARPVRLYATMAIAANTIEMAAFIS